MFRVKLIYTLGALIFIILGGLQYPTGSAPDANSTGILLAQEQATDAGDMENKPESGDIVQQEPIDENRTEDNQVDNSREDVKKQEIQVPAGRTCSLWDRSSYVGLIFSYGGYFPVADYASRYKPSHFIGGAIPVYYLTFFHLCPELHVRYTKMSSEFTPRRYNSTITEVQVFPAILFRWDFALPERFRGPIQVYARIYDGITRLTYNSVDALFPYLGKRNIIENINIFGFSVGCNYFIYRGLFVGLDIGYSIIATAGKPLQAMSFMMQTGYRIL